MCIILQILQIIILMNWYYILVIVFAIVLVCLLVFCMVVAKCHNLRNVSENKIKKYAETMAYFGRTSPNCTPLLIIGSQF